MLFTKKKKDKKLKKRDRMQLAPSLLGQRLSEAFARQLRPYSPDALVTGGGMAPDISGYDIYRDMLRDEMVSAALDLKIGAVSSRCWKVVDARGGADGEDCAFLTEQLKRLGYRRTVRRILGCLVFGFSVLEKVYGYAPGGLIELKDLRQIEPDHVSFDFDRHLKFANLQFHPSTIGGPMRRIPREKFLITTYNPQDETPYGRSDLREAYRSFWSKDFVMKSLLIFLEVFGHPVKVGIAPGWSDEEERSAMLSALNNMQTNSGFVLPEGWQLQMVEAVKGSGSHLEAIREFDRQIARAIIGQTLMVTQGEGGTGSYALGQVHERVFELMVDDLSALVADSLTELVSELGELNWGAAGFSVEIEKPATDNE